MFNNLLQRFGIISSKGLAVFSSCRWIMIRGFVYKFPLECSDLGLLFYFLFLFSRNGDF